MKYVPARKPWEHQRRASRFLKENAAAAALLMVMRTGKTKVTLDDFGELELEGDCQDLAVVAPAGVYRTWEEAALEHLSEDLRGRILIHVWDSGGGVGHQRFLDHFMRNPKGRPRLLLANVEATSTVKRLRDAVVTFLGQRRSMAVYDESTTIKSPDAERAIFAVEKVKPASNYRRILSGLPTPKSPLDAYMQFNFLDQNILGFRSFSAFSARYAVTRMAEAGPIMRSGGRPLYNEDGSVRRRMIPQIVNYRDVDSIRQKIAAHSFRVRLEDCYDLPPDMYLYRDVEWHPEQRRIYEEVKNFATAELASQEHVTVSQVVTQMLRLHQIVCGHVVTEEGEVRDVPERRTESLLQFLEEYDGKAVIWCSYNYNIERVSAAIARHFSELGRPAKVARFWGGNRKSREEEDRMFREDPECRWMVSTPPAGKFGRYWAMADVGVYFSNTANYEDREQSEYRIKATDKSVSVGYFDMRIPGCGIERRMVETLRKKRSLAQEINGDEWREWLS